ncbi:diacylglycerol kinase family protein [Saliterribacillus persicus]|uniref:Undecaprenol kinase n=1 Tax=Saliterribacillus persicus TaxID=930114 RepID=A0A368XDN8_9BACI|nr:diacylglycerol kinase family protein [Saliterribacillus persicus]RCW65336.1 undecaprenol kinase [Saliterribacillus persicus]
MRSGYPGNKKDRVGFYYAWNGIILALKTEKNVRIHFIITLAVLLLGVFLSLSQMEWIVLTLTISAVISLELVNTAIERALDVISTEYNESIGLTKDLAAASVFISAIAAFIIGCIIFLPKISSVFFN